MGPLDRAGRLAAAAEAAPRDQPRPRARGRRPETYEHNKEFLQTVYDEGLMLRRINIRQVMAFAGTEMAETGADIAQEHKDQFQAYKREVRETVDNPMLDRVVPPGTVLPDVHLEYHQDGKTFGRQLGTYALLVAVPYRASASSAPPSTWRSRTTATARSRASRTRSTSTRRRWTS